MVESSKNVFSLMKKTLWTGGPSSTSEYTYGNRDGAASHLGSIREKLSKR
ncbi:hypothetical protein ACT7C4_12880 [Bacillus pacificus]